MRTKGWAFFILRYYCEHNNSTFRKSPIMNNRKRWNNKEEAVRYAHKALDEGNRGLSFCAACDYLGFIVNRDFHDVLYADWLLSRGISYIKEEISDIEWELNNTEYVEAYKYQPSTDHLEDYLKIAKDELRYLTRRIWRSRKYASHQKNT